jgi:RHS repeat-associated protein
VSRRVPDAPGVGVLSRVRSLTLGSVLAISALAGLPAIGSAAITPTPGVTGDEVPELATAKSRAFRQEDGSVVERIYGAAVNYRDAKGTWRHIDTTLERDGRVLKAAAAPVPTRLPSVLGEASASVADGGFTASLEPLALEGEAEVSGSSATFTAAAPGLDLKLDALRSGFRHTTVLTSPKAPSKLDFDLHVTVGATVKAHRDGSATIISPEGTRQIELSPSFGWVDNNTRDVRRVATTVRRSGAGWRIRLDLGSKWIRTALRSGRTVTVDPTVTVPTASKDAALLSIAPDSSGYAAAAGALLIAKVQTALEYRAAFQFDLSSVPADARVLDAKLAIHANSNPNINTPAMLATSHSMSVHEITAPWDAASTSWNARGSGTAWTSAGGDFVAGASATVADVRPADGWTYWRPTQLVQRWVSGVSENHGLMVRQTNDAPEALVLDGIDAGGTSFANKLPYLQVRYVPSAGQRRDDTYLSESLNDRATMGVGVGSGNLLLSSQDISIAGVGQPLSLARSYNTALADYQTGSFGNGGTSGLSGDVHLTTLANGSMSLQLGDGSVYRYPKNSGGGFDPAARLEADLVRDPDGSYLLTYRRSQSKWHFRTDGKLDQLKDKNNNTINLTYTGTGVLSKLTDTQGRELPVTVNANGQITKVVDPSGRSWNYTYGGTAGNRLTVFTDPEGNQTKYAYDTSSRLKKITTPGGRVTLVTYDADNRVTEYVRVTNTDEESGPTTRLRYEQDDPRCAEADNAPKSTVVTDPRGNETTYCIDTQGRAVLTIDPKGRTQATKYTPQGQVEKFTDGTGSGSAINEATYSGLTNNLESTRGAMGETTTFGYKQGGTSLTDKYQPESQTNPDGQQQFFGYDNQGNVNAVRDAATDATSQMKATLTHNGDGTIATAKDGENRQNTYTYWLATDGGFRKGLLKTFAPPAPRAATTLNYDSLGRVTSATDGNNKTTTYTYDKLDRVKTTTFSGGSTLTYSYDSDGNKTAAADTSMGTETYAYDALNRRTSETLTADRTTAYVYDASGNLTQVADDFGITGYGYDELNRTCYAAPTDPGGGSCLTPPAGATTFKYDAAGKRTKTSYPNGVNVDEAPDLSGKPTTITTGTGANAVSRNYTYANLGSGKTGELVQTMQVNAGATTSFSYDSSSRLKTLRIGATPGVDEVTYNYDKAGNRTSFGVAANAANTIAPYTTTSTYNGANQLTAQTRNTLTDGSSSKTFTYDAQGNDAAYHWSVRNQLAYGNYAGFAYQGPNMADLREDNGHSVESNLLGKSRRYAPPNDAPTSYLRAPDGELLGRKDPAGNWSYYVKDALGSVIGVYNAAGTLTRKYDYDPDGNTWRDSSGKPEDFGYTGAYTRLGAQTLYHNGLRWYDPKTARWTSADSLDQPGDLQNANAYLYVGSNPVNDTDPTGQYGFKNSLRGLCGWICPAAKKGEKVVQSKQVRKTTCAVTSAVVAWRVGVRFQPDSAAAGGAVAGGAAAGSFCG